MKKLWTIAETAPSNTPSIRISSAHKPFRRMLIGRAGSAEIGVSDASINPHNGQSSWWIPKAKLGFFCAKLDERVKKAAARPEFEVMCARLVAELRVIDVEWKLLTAGEPEFAYSCAACRGPPDCHC